MMLRLSICIATFNRADFIAETLDSIIPQMTSEVEIVVVDGASSDATPAVLAPYVERCPALRYIRESVNSGIDADFDKAVGYARGEFCWLMTDDDLLTLGAISRILAVLTDQTNLVVVDAEVYDSALATMLQSGRLRFRGRRDYSAGDADRFMADAGEALSFIGGTIVRRSWWLERDRASYFGTLFVHVGVIFQQPVTGAIVLGEPLILLRLGNAMWTARGFEIWMFKWPDLVWSFPGIGNAAKAIVTPRQPWRSVTILTSFRANGAYGLSEYRRFFGGLRLGGWRLVALGLALAPGRLVNFAVVAYLKLRGRSEGASLYALTRCSRYSSSLGRRMASLGASRG